MITIECEPIFLVDSERKGEERGGGGGEGRNESGGVGGRVDWVMRRTGRKDLNGSKVEITDADLCGCESDFFSRLLCRS